MQARLPILLVAAAGLTATLTFAGPLNPPAGPVAPTMKTLTEVEPRTAISAANTPGNASATFVISQPGSYYLTANVGGVAGKNVILVTAPQVVIDLNGFAIAGGLDGINFSGACTFVVKNGVVSSASGSGIHCAVNTATGTIEDVTAQWCTGDGFSLGAGSTLRRCIARNNSRTGFHCGSQTLMESCLAIINTSHGFETGTFCQMVDCSADANNGDGFNAGQWSTFSGCRATENDNGFISNESKFDLCEARANGSKGFDIGGGSTVTQCTARYNGLQGLRAGDRNTIVGSRFRDQSGGNYAYAGLWLDGSSNRVDNCESSANGYGFYISSGTTQNVIVRSRATSNAVANYITPANNQVAPVVNNPGSNAYSTMTPWSNIVY